MIGNPAWNDFLLHDNEGEIRKSLRPFFPNDTHAQMVVRLPGNLDIETEGKAAELVQDATADLEFDDATITTTGAPVLLKDLNDYLTGGMLVLGAIAVGLMVIILLVVFDVRWRLLPAGRHPHRRASGPSAWPATSASRSRSSPSPACP